MCHVKVVLLCKGRGGDAASYRPTRDESQWWNRRDALVRCVSSFLHGPWSAHCSSRELVLLHDEDYARIHMTVANPLSCRLLPTEQNIVSAWKSAAASSSSASKDRFDSPWTCRVERVHESGASTSSAAAVQHMDSKRQVLEHIQAHCSLDFLRGHGLNSKPDVVLRKTNKKALVQAWHQWTSQHKPPKSSSSASRLESIFAELLHVPSASVVAGYLHESCESELPCFNPPPLPAADPNLHVVLFLGAVRDMHPSENALLRRVCASKNIPLTGVRLGAVPEFTSKILSVVAFHQARGVLGPALLHQLASSKHELTTASTKHETSSTGSSTSPMHVHVLCSVPLRQADLSTALGQRQGPLWAMVRVTVATLWRSHYMRTSSSTQGDIISTEGTPSPPGNVDRGSATFADSTVAPPLTTTLTFLLADGVHVTFEQATFVTCMAEQHQAAPTEFQILQAIISQSSGAAVKSTSIHDVKDGEAMAAWMAAAVAPSVVLDLDDGDDDGGVVGKTLVDAMYASPEPAAASGGAATVAVLLSLHPTEVLPTHEALRRATAALGLPVVRQRIVHTPVTDTAAASITMLQHFAYQHRLVEVLHVMATTSRNKSKTKAKKAKKNARRNDDDSTSSKQMKRA
ncbi:hypothetical protein DYB38_002353 [Aphanomyces astaci]|uniref:Uncharacterized protein n=1 Tax=Aphanomyces astaci TaxID=112090 RepID=A0A397DEA4_APHAT|nr:hypothetical protein DYB38_002353 [Aphanomyces astaci]